MDHDNQPSEAMSLFLYWSLAGAFGISSVFVRDGVSVSQLWTQALTDCCEIWNQSFWYIGAVA